MNYFPNIQRNYYNIVHRQVISIDDYHQAGSLKGRGICLLHTLATPLKALSGLGRLVLSIGNKCLGLLGVLTLNTHPKELCFVAASFIDIPVGAILLPFALSANIIRGLVGTIFHPGAMIRDETGHTSCRNFDWDKAQHNCLYGTLVNYPLNT